MYEEISQLTQKLINDLLQTGEEGYEGIMGEQGGWIQMYAFDLKRKEYGIT